MRMIAIALVALSGSNTLGGVISFTPAEITVEPSQDTVIAFDLAVESSDLAGFEAIDVIVGSDDLEIVRFDWWDPSFCNFDQCNQSPPTVYASEWKFGNFFITPQTTPFFLGTLYVDYGGLPPGDYQVLIDSERDNGRSGIALGAEMESLFGSAAVHVVPEPSTILLLLLGTGMAAMAKRSR